MSLQDLTAAADKVAHLPRSKEEVARLRGQLQEKRELARVGLRANNLSAGADSRAIVNRIQDEVRKYFGGKIDRWLTSHCADNEPTHAYRHALCGVIHSRERRRPVHPNVCGVGRQLRLLHSIVEDCWPRRPAAFRAMELYSGSRCVQSHMEPFVLSLTIGLARQRDSVIEMKREITQVLNAALRAL